jgi:hypothetical protein
MGPRRKTPPICKGFYRVPVHESTGAPNRKRHEKNGLVIWINPAGVRAPPRSKLCRNNAQKVLPNCYNNFLREPYLALCNSTSIMVSRCGSPRLTCDKIF